MRTFVRITIEGLLVMHGAAAFADCTRPRPAFSIPEGGTAAEQDFTAANSALTDFGSKVRDYLNCMNGEMSQKAVGKDEAAREEINKAHAAAYNEAANELRGLAACYKTQREIFKSTGGGTKPKPADCVRGQSGQRRRRHADHDGAHDRGVRPHVRDSWRRQLALLPRA